eukprot:Platyproteum_vivax@DN12362_c0_g1_i1.p1
MPMVMSAKTTDKRGAKKSVLAHHHEQTTSVEVTTTNACLCETVAYMEQDVKLAQDKLSDMQSKYEAQDLEAIQLLDKAVRAKLVWVAEVANGNRRSSNLCEDLRQKMALLQTELKTETEQLNLAQRDYDVGMKNMNERLSMNEKELNQKRSERDMLLELYASMMSEHMKTLQI